MADAKNSAKGPDLQAKILIFLCFHYRRTRAGVDSSPASEARRLEAAGKEAFGFAPGC